jgi:Ca2+-binding EF-hand superfamily protein
MFRVLSAVLLAAGAAVAAPALAQVAATPVPRTEFIQVMDTEFKQMDADKNGILTKKEIEDFQRSTSILVARQRNIALFQALDKDKNGQLTPSEFANLPMNVPAPNPAPVLAQTDTNRDGQITMVEYRTGKLASFDRMDTDKDGIVSIAEMKAAGLIK